MPQGPVWRRPGSCVETVRAGVAAPGAGVETPGADVETHGALKRPTAWRKVDAEPLVALIHLYQKCYDQEGYVRSMKSVELIA